MSQKPPVHFWHDYIILVLHYARPTRMLAPQESCVLQEAFQLIGQGLAPGSLLQILPWLIIF